MSEWENIRHTEHSDEAAAVKLDYVCPACEDVIEAPISLEGSSAECPSCKALIKRWPTPKTVEVVVPLSLDDEPKQTTDWFRTTWDGADRYAWAIVVVPILSALVELAVDQTLLILALAGNVALTIADQRRLVAMDKPRPNELWVLLIPVYLWKRASLLKQPQVYFWAWVASFVISIAMVWGLYVRKELESEAKPLVTQIIRENYGGSSKCVRVEISGSAGDGYYNAIATTDNDRHYRIVIQKTKNMIYVEIPRQ